MTPTEIISRVKELLKLRFGAEAGTCSLWTTKNSSFYVRMYEGAPPECLTKSQMVELIEALEMLWKRRNSRC